MNVNEYNNRLINSGFHKSANNWTIWAHLPHNTDWSIKSYIPIYTFTTIEETIAVLETLPNTLIENSMLFIMKQGIKPTWEDPKNRSGGCFSYKIPNINICKVWKELTYVMVGETISKHINFTNSVTGITISPKKSFCIIKIWMTDCNNQDSSVVTQDIKGLTSQGCIFRKHTPEY
jgi:hypothetical protein